MTTVNRFRKLWFVVAMVAAWSLMPSRAMALWPFWDVSKEGTTVLYPFYVHEGDFVMAFPFYYRTNLGRDHHFLWPLVKTSEGRLTRVAPVWFSADQDTFTVFPLWRQTPEYTLWSLPPVYNRHDGNFKAIFPLFAKSPNMLFVAPSFYWRTDEEATRWRLFPVYFHKETADTRKDVIPGLFYSRKQEDERIMWLAPSFYWRTDEEATRWRLFPVYFHKETADTREDMIPGLFYHGREEDERTLWIAPSYYRRSGDRRMWNLFPVFSSIWSPEYHAYKIPLIFHYTTDPHGYDFWLLPFKKRSDEIVKTIGLVPISVYRTEKKPDGDEVMFTLLPYGRVASPKRSTTFVLPLFLKHWKAGKEGDLNEFWLLPYVRGTGPEMSYHGILPLYYTKSETKNEEHSQTFNLLWLLYRRAVTTDADGEVLEYHRRFLIFSESKDREGTRVFKLIGIPVREQTR